RRLVEEAVALPCPGVRDGTPKSANRHDAVVPRSRRGPPRRLAVGACDRIGTEEAGLQDLPAPAALTEEGWRPRTRRGSSREFEPTRGRRSPRSPTSAPAARGS